VPRLELGKQAALHLHLRTVALGAEDGDRKRSCRHCAENADEFFILTQSGERPER
jgi:hypothetical protein